MKTESTKNTEATPRFVLDISKQVLLHHKQVIICYHDKVKLKQYADTFGLTVNPDVFGYEHEDIPFGAYQRLSYGSFFSELGGQSKFVKALSNYDRALFAMELAENVDGVAPHECMVIHTDTWDNDLKRLIPVYQEVETEFDDETIVVVDNEPVVVSKGADTGKKTRRQFAPAFKRAAVEAAYRTSAYKVAKALGITAKMVYYWRDQYEAGRLNESHAVAFSRQTHGKVLTTGDMKGLTK